MTHILNLECTFHTLRLRPTLAVLHRIEAEAGITLHDLTKTPLKADVADCILRAAGADNTSLTEMQRLETAQSFLAYALQDVQTLQWREMFSMYVGMMGKPAAEFWNITPAEYSLAVEGFCQLHGITPDTAQPPATSQDLAEMIGRFGSDA